MSEQTQEAPVVKSQEQMDKEFAELAPQLQAAITALNNQIEQHNTNVSIVTASKNNDPKMLLQEAREKNPSGNKQIARINAEIEKLQSQIEKYVADANKIIADNNLLPATKTPEQIEELRTEIAKSGKELREQANALVMFEKMMPGINLAQHLSEITSLRGVSTTTSSGGSSTPKLRFSKITVNDATEIGENKVYGVVDGKEKYTFTFTAQFLKKVFPGVKIVANELTAAYLKDVDKNNLPAEHTFEIEGPKVVTDNSETTSTIKITCYRD